jgi:alpha-ketoglutarate-dependent taurine dioxygenase
MTQLNDNASVLNTFEEKKQKLIKLSQEEPVIASPLTDGQQLPLVIQPNTGNLDLLEWAGANRAYLESELGKYGAILFRGFKLNSIPEFEGFVRAVSGEALEYNERSSPRSQISGRIYTSTDHPSDKQIFLHNEQSYNLVFPMKLFFFCVEAAKEGGATPIADTRKVFERIPGDTRERFMKRKYLYMRNFRDGWGLSWQEAFQTSQKADVEQYCRRNQIEFEWKTGNRLKTKQVREVAIGHPKTGEWVWFNHLTFFHVNTLDREIREEITMIFADGDLPNNTYYGDGERIEDNVMDCLREAYQKEQVRFDWNEGDVLMIDNMLVAHGRESYIGNRSIAVAMTEAWGWDNE